MYNLIKETRFGGLRRQFRIRIGQKQLEGFRDKVAEDRTKRG